MEESKAALIKKGALDLGNNLIQIKGRKILLRKRAVLNFPLIKVEKLESFNLQFDLGSIHSYYFLDDERIYFSFGTDYGVSAFILDMNTGESNKFADLPNGERPVEYIANNKAFIYSSLVNDGQDSNNFYLYSLYDNIKSSSGVPIPYTKIKLSTKFRTYMEKHMVHFVFIDEKKADLPPADKYTFILLHHDTGIVGIYNILSDTEIMLTDKESKKYIDDSITYNYGGRLRDSYNRSIVRGESFGFKDLEEGVFVNDKITHKEKKVFDYGNYGFICPDESTRLVIVENKQGKTCIVVVDENGKNIRQIDYETDSRGGIELYCISPDRENLLFATGNNNLQIMKLSEPLY
jgi:hypothetical protein